VLGTWLSFKMHAGLLGAWLVSTAIIAVGTMMTRSRNDF
jgi:hypothetical protein